MLIFIASAINLYNSNIVNPFIPKNIMYNSNIVNPFIPKNIMRSTYLFFKMI